MMIIVKFERRNYRKPQEPSADQFSPGLLLPPWNFFFFCLKQKLSENPGILESAVLNGKLEAEAIFYFAFYEDFVTTALLKLQTGLKNEKLGGMTFKIQTQVRIEKQIYLDPDGKM